MANPSTSVHALPQLGRSVSIEQAARLLNVSRRTIYNRIRDGRLQTIRTIGGSQRVVVASITNPPARESRALPPRSTPSGQGPTMGSGGRVNPEHGGIMSSATRFALSALLASVCLVILPAASSAETPRARLSADLSDRIEKGDTQPTSVLVTTTQAHVDALAARHGLRVGRRLQSGAVLEVPAGKLAELADDASVGHLSGNQTMRSQMAVTNATIGADLVQTGQWAVGVPTLTGRGVGIAVIDTGVASVPELRGRIVARVDFTSSRGRGIDEHGHGTHVIGIAAANGATRTDSTRGVAPGAHILSLKALGSDGAGDIADVIAAVDYAVANRARYNVRVINMSLGGAVLQSYQSDPLCDAVERAYRAGIAVVVSAGNFGRLADGRLVLGAVTTPGISPFAITVGSLNTNGTPFRADDVVAPYSSKGPTMFDGLVKPDLVAPGHHVQGLLAPNSTFARRAPREGVWRRRRGQARDVRNQYGCCRRERCGGRAAGARQSQPGACPACAATNGNQGAWLRAPPGG